MKVTLCAPNVGFKVQGYTQDRMAAIEGLGLHFHVSGDPEVETQYAQIGDCPIEADLDLETLVGFVERTGMEVSIQPNRVVEIRL